MKNENDNNNTTRSGIGFFGALTIAFIVLKLCNVINWSWFWVLSPLWIPALVVVILFVIVMVALMIKGAMHHVGGDDDDAGE